MTKKGRQFKNFEGRKIFPFSAVLNFP